MQAEAIKSEIDWQRFREAGEEMKEAGREFYLAGLGILGYCAERGREQFSELVERGRKVEADRKAPGVPEPLRRAGQDLDELRRKVEQRFEDAASRALKRVGVPDREEVQQLIERIETLTAKVERMAAEQRS